jgi:glutamate/tyrosine decarboxylase-like PLP-dependent enzyme
MTGPAERDELRPVFSRPAELGDRLGGRPRNRLGDDEILPATAYQIVHDETMLDGNARLTSPATSPPASPRSGRSSCGTTAPTSRCSPGG